MGQNVASKESLQETTTILQGSCKSFFLHFECEDFKQGNITAWALLGILDRGCRFWAEMCHNYIFLPNLGPFQNDEIVKIQAFLRANKAREDYRTLSKL